MNTKSLVVQVLPAAFVLCASTAFGAGTEGFQCDSYVGNVATEPPITRTFIEDESNETISLADGRYKVSFEGYGTGMRTTISVDGDLLPLSIQAFNGTSGSVYAREGANEISVTCIRRNAEVR